MFAVGLALGARTTELGLVKVDQFKEEIVNGKSELVYYPKVGSRCGESKNHRGGIKYVKYKPRRIPIHDIMLLNGKLNVYKLVQEYFAVRRRANLGHDRFFWIIIKVARMMFILSSKRSQSAETQCPRF